MKASYLIENRVPEDLGVSAVVVAADYHNPLEQIDAITKTLNSKRIRGNVLFDLLLANGSKRNRYFLVFFTGEGFDMSSLKSADAHYVEYCNASAAILKNHIDEIDTSLLTSALKYAVKKGIPF